MDNSLYIYLNLVDKYRFLGYLPSEVKSKISQNMNVSSEILEKVYQYAKTI